MTSYSPDEYGDDDIVNWRESIDEFADLGAGASGYDSLLVDTTPSWLYRLMKAVNGVDYSGDARVAKTFAYPFNEWNLASTLALKKHGYITARISTATWSWPHGSVWTEPAPGDTARFPRLHYEGMDETQGTEWIHKRNSFNATMGGSSFTNGDSWWGPISEPKSEGAIRQRAREVLEKWTVDYGNSHFIFYDHDQQYADTQYGDAGLDSIQLYYIMDEMLTWGGDDVWIAPIVDIRQYMNQKLSFIADPGWSHADWDWTAEQRVWYLPSEVYQAADLNPDIYFYSCEATNVCQLKFVLTSTNVNIGVEASYYNSAWLAINDSGSITDNGNGTFTVQLTESLGAGCEIFGALSLQIRYRWGPTGGAYSDYYEVGPIAVSDGDYECPGE